MLKELEKSHFEEFSDFLNNKLRPEEKVKNLITRLKKQNFRPELIQVFNKLKNEEELLISSYNTISDEINENLSSLMDEINNFQKENLKLEIESTGIENLEEYKSLYSKVPIEKNSIEYMKFLEIYEKMNKNSLEILNKKKEIEKLLNLQNLLDLNFASEIVEVQYLSGKLNLLINNFGSFKTREILNTYLLKFSRKKELEKLILGKEEAFEELKNTIKNSLEGDSLIIDKSTSLTQDFLKSAESKKITRDIFISKK